VRYAVAMLGSSDRRFLAQVTSSVPLQGAANRWSYAIRTCTYGGPANGRVIELVRNIREEFNSASVADGNDLTSPPTTVGPVAGLVEAWTDLSATGACVTLFDRPNPVGCGT